MLATARRGVEEGAHTVVVIGHSLGAAVGQFAAVYLAQELGVSVTTRLFGPPRVGTKGWADQVDSTLVDAQQAIHSTDIVPHLALRRQGFERSGGEVWIDYEGRWLACSGRENAACANSVPASDRTYEFHSGPFDGVRMGWGCYP